jgi:hypothetical protein
MKNDFNKTAIQELIQWTIDVQYPIDIEFRDKVIELLEKEKEQIIKAHIDGFDYIVAEFKKQEFAEQYFNYTYNKNDNKTNF